MRRSFVLSMALIAVAPRPAAALDRFEIQVYTADINEPGQVGLELHLNYTFLGIAHPEYDGQVPPLHVGRLTIEPAVGVTPWLELGAYLQFMAAPGGDLRFGGTKFRAKFVLPEAVQARLGIPFFLGLNAEIGRVPHAVEEAGWANEFRPIIGWKDDRWLVSVNPIFGYALSGPDKFRIDLEPCAKISYDTHLGFALGVEYYAGLGFIGEGFLPVRDQEHLLLAVFDLAERPGPRGTAGAEPPAHGSGWEVNVGVGAGLTSATAQHLVAKAIVGRSF